VSLMDELAHDKSLHTLTQTERNKMNHRFKHSVHAEEKKQFVIAYCEFCGLIAFDTRQKNESNKNAQSSCPLNTQTE